MKMMKVTLRITLFFLFVCCNSALMAQNNVECRLVNPFCSDEAQELTFANTIGDLDGLGEIGCLNTSPNPAWYYIRIDEPGELVFDIQQWVDADEDSRLDNAERQLDVDFIAWGPFNTFFLDCDILSEGCDLNGDGENIRPIECENNADFPLFYFEDQDNTNIVDCSYARTPIDDEEAIFTETFTIPDAQTGEYYIILMTNFSDEPGVIQLQQTNLDEPGAGTTDCSILEPGVGEDIATCGEFPVSVIGQFPGAVSYQWARADLGTTNFVDIAGATAPLYENVTSSGVYRLSGFDANGAPVNGSPDELIVLDVSNAVSSVTYTVAEESFAGSYTITAEVEASPDVQLAGFEDFEYRLDRDLGNGFIEYRSFQSSPVFENVPPGDYFVTARYADCPASEVSLLEDIIMIVGYPKYFTPNGDGFHETWNVINLENQSATALVFIFDRYGKLLKQIRSDGEGWDGTYNGKNMPSSDYWFRVEFNEPTDPNMRRRVFAGSFSLIR